MKNLILYILLIFPLFISAQFSPAPTTPGTVYGITKDGTGGGTPRFLVTIDPVNVSVNYIGQIVDFNTGAPYSFISDLAINSSGELFAFQLPGGWNGTSSGQLLQIDPATGQAVVVTSISSRQRGGSFDLNDVLWSVDHFAGGTSSSGLGINNLNVVTGMVSNINTFPVSYYWGPVATNPVDGQVYAGNLYSSIYSINPTDGSPTLFSNENIRSYVFFDLAGNLYHDSSEGGNLMRIDQGTTTSTDLGPITGLNQGSTVVAAATHLLPPPPPIPTMGQWGIIILGFLFVIFGLVATRRSIFAIQ